MREQKHYFIHVHLYSHPNDCFWYAVENNINCLVLDPVLMEAVPADKVDAVKTIITVMFGRRLELMELVECNDAHFTDHQKQLMRIK